MTDRRKAPITPADDTRSADRVASSDVRILKGASALANHNLARRLCQAIIFPADRELLKSQPMIEMLSSFYPTMIQVSSSSSFFFIIVFLTIGLLLAADLQYVQAGGRVPEVRRCSGGLEE